MAEAVAAVNEVPAAQSTRAAEQVSVATQWQLMWWRFRRHKLALASGVIILLFYVLVLFAEFFAYSNPHKSDETLSLLPPQPIHWLDNGEFSPHVYGLSGKRDPKTGHRRGG